MAFELELFPIGGGKKQLRISWGIFRASSFSVVENSKTSTTKKSEINTTKERRTPNKSRVVVVVKSLRSLRTDGRPAHPL